MIKNRVLLIMLATAALFTSSCASNSDYEDDFSYLEIFDYWAAENYPHLEKIDDGFYLKLTKNYTGTDNFPTDSTYVTVRYTVRYPDGTYVVNMDDVMARKLGTFSYSTRYDLDFAFRMVNYNSYVGISYAHYYALQMMNIGDEVEFIAAPYYGYYYSSDMYEGFGGESSITTNSFHCTMTLVDATDDPETTAKADVKSYISDDGGSWTTVETGLYLKKTQVNDTAADSIHKDTSIYINYTVRMLDGFVIETNDYDTAFDNYIYDSSNSYEELLYTYDGYDDDTYYTITEDYGLAIKKAISAMNLGEIAEVVAYPEFCYGQDGYYPSSGTLIYPYTPLRFTIETIWYEMDDDE